MGVSVIRDVSLLNYTLLLKTEGTERQAHLYSAQSKTQRACPSSYAYSYERIIRTLRLKIEVECRSVPYFNAVMCSDGRVRRSEQIAANRLITVCYTADMRHFRQYERWHLLNVKFDVLTVHVAFRGHITVNSEVCLVICSPFMAHFVPELGLVL